MYSTGSKSVRDQHLENHTKKAHAVSLALAVALLLAKGPIVGYIHTCTASTLLLYLTLLLKRVATKAATTTMETKILTVVETVVMLSVLLLFINAGEMKSRIIR